MGSYRSYTLDPDARINAPGRDFEAADDRAAIDHIIANITDHDTTLWKGERLLAAVDHQTKQPKYLSPRLRD